VILLYSLLFLIPGLVKMIRLIFVPLVVMIYRPYHEGKVDALKESSRLTMGAFWGIASFFLVSQLFIAFVVMMLPSGLHKIFQLKAGSLSNLLIDFIFNVPIGVLVELIAAVGLLKIFERIVIFKEGKNELAF